MMRGQKTSLIQDGVSPRKMNQYPDSESSSKGDLLMEQAIDPSFLECYLPENNSAKLRIPRTFLKNLKGFIPENISLKNSSGRVWPAKLAFINDDLHITHGWDRYVKDQKLESGEFVMFRYQENPSTFLVMVYGRDKVVKLEPRKKLTGRRSRGNGDVEGRGIGKDFHCTDAGRPGSIKFYTIFKNKLNYVVRVPLGVIMACVFTLPQTVELKSDKGSIEVRLRIATDRYVLGYTGVRDFMRRNAVKEGDKLEFEVIRDDGYKIKHIIMRNTSV